MKSSSLPLRFGHIVSCTMATASLLLLLLSCHASAEESTTTTSTSRQFASSAQHAMMWDARHVVENSSLGRLPGTQKRQHLHQPGPPLVPLKWTRGGGGRNNNNNNKKKKKKKTVATSTTKKSPLGLPAIFGATLYGKLDAIPFALFFAVLANILEGTAQKVYAFIGILHTLLAFVTNYDGSGSIVQRYLKVDVGVSMSIMYWFDLLAATVFILLPSYVDGYTDEKLTFALRSNALSGLLFFFPFSEVGGDN